MPTDLTKVQDHPATLLNTLGNAMTHSIEASFCTQSATYHAAQFLRTYEDEHNVTFAALDNDALAAVREAYKTLGGRGDGYGAVDLYRAIDSLLGLDS